MAVKKFRFVSPGVFVNEIDNSQLPASPAGIGPVVIGRSVQGPGLRPVTVNSFSEFVGVFGPPVPGASGDDVWRDGNRVGPTYGPYAAQAYLRNSAPLTYVRLLGAESSDATSAGKAGWKVAVADSTSGQGAYGLFIFNSSSIAATSAIAASGSLLVNAGLDTNDKFALSASTGGEVTQTRGFSVHSTSGSQTAGYAWVQLGATAAQQGIFISGAIASSSMAEFYSASAGPAGLVNITASTGGTAGGGTFSLRLGTRGNGTYIQEVTDGSGKISIPNQMQGGQSTAAGVALTGALAAIFYVTGQDSNKPALALSGNLAGTASPVVGSAALVKSVSSGTGYEFKLHIENYKGSSALTSSFNFNTTSERYIRKVFNTNPQLANSQTTATPIKYWLGETFDRHLSDTVSAASGNDYYACLLPMASGSAANGGDFQIPVVEAETPWIISQDLTTDYTNYNPTNMQKLFKLVALDEPGAWTSRNIKISIQDVKAPSNDFDPYGSFAVVIRRLKDSDNVVEVLEQFNNCNLNPNSLNYIARKIGDRYRAWDDSLKRYREYGQYNNASRYIRVSMNSDVDLGVADKSYLPYGFLGMVKYANLSINDEGVSDSGKVGDFTIGNSWILGSGSAYGAAVPTVAQVSGAYFTHALIDTNASVTQGAQLGLSASVKFPAPAMRSSASLGGLGNYTDAYFGFQVGRSAGNTRFDESNLDLLHALGGLSKTDQFNSTAGGVEASTAFSLDDVRHAGTNNASWELGTRAAGQSWTALSSSWKQVLDEGFDRFTVPMHGGFDGLDVQSSEPFNNTDLDASATEFNWSPYYSLKRAIDAVADPEVVEMNVATIPGVWQEGLTAHLINTCEDRADALALVDLKGGFKPSTENTDAFSDRVGSVTTTITNLKNRGINSSYGCAYYPWVQIRDTINGNQLWVPPSVAALGTFSSSQRKSQVWFAPAGFNRGGLTVGAAGVPVVNVVEKLTRSQRDDLYEANINPIAKFPAEGIVIFGQKTLQVTPSALDRINVRRLLIFVKKRISQIASQLLFDPNVKQTWDRFVGQVTPFLDEVKTNFGLSDYLLVLDESTTTPDLVDRNIMYAQIFLKPTRAIEFIALDFNITRTGASFVD